MTESYQASDFGKVAVLLGGNSAEREVSLNSGQAVLDALLRQGVDAHAVDPAEGIVQGLSGQDFDRAFIILHGRGGEDGSMQGLLEQLELPYTGSGVLASALGMDKLRTKLIWRAADLPTPPSIILNADSKPEQVVEQLGLPLMVKPVHEGSSIGMSKVESVDELRAAWQAAAEFDGEVMAERWIHGREYTVAILGDEALPVIGLETPHSFYDYEAKYQAATTQYHCPSDLSAEEEARVQLLAQEAFACVGASGWGRVDLFLDEGGQAWLLEINTVPGMTDHSLVPMAAKAAGIDFDALVMRILAGSLKETRHG